MIRRLEVQAKQEFEHSIRDFNASVLVRKAGEKQRDREIAKAAQGGDAKAVAMRWLDDEVQEPTRRRYITNDSTVEKLGVILNQNPNGLLVYRDELVGLWRCLDKDGQEGARAFYLESWNGNGSFTYDRIGRGTLDIEACCISVFGSIQPGPLRDYLRDAVRGGRGDDGLLQRFQLLVWPDIPNQWRNVDRWPETAAKQKAWEIYQKLDAPDPTTIGAHPVDEDGGIPYLRFDAEAQLRFDDWRAELEHRLRSDEESDAFLAHLGKYRSLIPTLSLIFHLADSDDGEVSALSLNRAIGWSRYLESHARRLYGAMTGSHHGPAKALAKRIINGDLSDGFTLREVYQPHWSQLDCRDEAQEAVDVLTALHWLRSVELRTGGRPTTVYCMNPRITEMAMGQGIKSNKSPSTDTFAPFETSAGGNRNHNDHNPDDVNRLFDEFADNQNDYYAAGF
jgi:putative DNA primase/helicase